MGFNMEHQMEHQKVHLKQCIKQCLKQCLETKFETKLKDNSIFSNMQMLLLSFFNRVKRATLVALCWQYKYMDCPCTHERR